ncbi:MAG TPA: rod shape-determining protein MreD [Candidatus Omnitrophota bacterium]|nr:rod shape-determining protein MreD [Candidatus Omnitrophota bacterium]HNQ51010.1 rod shape-determining protein MreD [Candidatus Omnitrophota bacterium]HQO38406.1 rod shape-determining protein MreD [Candidatus Omnitrophota bacterium]HQQ06199.1 rod shape-determining protein MreD [Candidatus Omnitrophota bacterium]
MRKIIFLGLVLAAVLVQSTLADGMRILGVKPDLVWVMVMAAALYFDFSDAVICAVLAGILKDVLGISSFGAYTLFLPLWAAAVRSLSKRISFDHAAVSAVFLAVMIFVNAVIIRSIPPVSTGRLSFMAFMHIAVIESVYTAVVFACVSPWLRRVAVSTLW